jgi:hypothetical protein
MVLALGSSISSVLETASHLGASQVIYGLMEALVMEQ